MVRLTTKLKQSTRSSMSRSKTGGFTLIELLISMAVGMVIIGSAFALVMANRQLLAADQERTNVNQNLRSALDILGADVRVAGERLGSSGVPAIAVRGGNELILRRAVLEQILPVCNQSNWFNKALLVSRNSNWPAPANNPECNVDAARNKNANPMPDDLEAWEEYRDDGQVKAYIYSRTRDYGEFFDYVEEEDTNYGYAIWSSENWNNIYRMTEQSSLYLLEERRYRVTDEGVLEIVVNDDANNPQRIVNGLDTFSITAVLADGSERTDFGVDAGDDWKDLRAIKIELKGEKGRTLSSQFFPRNALSR